MLYSIETKSLTKSFGDVTAVDDVSFTVENGEIFGFLGPNGAGKSTTMMILTTLLKPTSGKQLISGYDVRLVQKKFEKTLDMFNKKQLLMNILQDEKISYYKQNSITFQKMRLIQESMKS